jgi:hypothetical protein
VLDFLNAQNLPQNSIQTSGMRFGQNWTYQGREQFKDGANRFRVCLSSRFKILFLVFDLSLSLLLLFPPAELLLPPFPVEAGPGVVLLLFVGIFFDTISLTMTSFGNYITKPEHYRRVTTDNRIVCKAINRYLDIYLFNSSIVQIK